MPLEIHFSSMFWPKPEVPFLSCHHTVKCTSQRCFKLPSNTFHTLGLSTPSDLILLPSLARQTGLRTRASGAPSGSAKTPLIRTTRPPSEWTLRWNDLRCWVSRSVCSCEFFPHSFPPLLLPAPVPHLSPQHHPAPHIPVFSPPSSQLGHRWTGEVQVHRINLLPRSSR